MLRVRRLPDRPARGRGRAAGPEAAADPGASDRRDGRAAGGGGARRRGRATASACRGSAARTAPARTAAAGARTSATRPPSRATSATAATPSTRSRAPTSCCRCPTDYPDLQAAPLLCAGLIGYRALRLAEVEGLERPGRLGLYGFGASAHIVIQVARHLGHEVYVVHARRDRAAARARAGCGVGRRRRTSAPPVELDSAIIFAPAGRARAARARGGAQGRRGRLRRHPHVADPGASTTTCSGASASLRSVANLTRADGHEFLELAPQVPVRTEVEEFPLEDADEALRAAEGGRAARRRRAGALTRYGSREQVLGARADDRGRARAVVGGDVALEAAHDHDRLAAGLVAHERGGRRRPGRRPRRSSAVSSRPSASRLAAPVVERREAGAADRDVDLAEAPRAAEAVGDDDGRARRRAARASAARSAPRRARRGPSGSRHTMSSPGTFDWSTPAFAHTRPWRVRVISTPRSARSTSVLSSRITCTSARVLAERVAELARALPTARTSRSVAQAALRLGDDLLATTSTSPSPIAALAPAAAPRSAPARSSPGRDLRQAGERLGRRAAARSSRDGGELRALDLAQHAAGARRAPVRVARAPRAARRGRRRCRRRARATATVATA